jgi:hypothetical protein
VPFRRPNLVGVALPSALRALTAEVASSEVARNFERAQVRASAPLAQSIYLYSAALIWLARGSTVPLSSNHCNSSLDPPAASLFLPFASESLCYGAERFLWKSRRVTGKPHRIAIPMLRLRPQRTDELGADPDTAIYLELPRQLFFFIKLHRKIARQLTRRKNDDAYGSRPGTILTEGNTAGREFSVCRSCPRRRRSFAATRA